MRNFQKLKTIEDYEQLDKPENIKYNQRVPIPNQDSLMILRMLVRPKYGNFLIPKQLDFLKLTIWDLSHHDKVLTGIKDSWCYITVRHGLVKSVTDDQFHFDGASFRTDIIPERNYIWVNLYNPTEYKLGNLDFPDDFDPIKHNLFTFAEHQLKDKPIEKCKANQFYLLSPFCLHRRPIIEENTVRTFYRICFSDIESRSEADTQNELLPTFAYGRNPVETFRNKLLNYYEN